MAYKNRLKEHRARLGLNQQEMGRRVGVSRQTISQIERGIYSPSVEIAFKISQVCEAPVEEIFGTPDMKSPVKIEKKTEADHSDSTFDSDFDGNTLHPLFSKIDFK